MTKYITYSITNYYTKAIEIPDDATDSFIAFTANQFVGEQVRENRDFFADDYDYNFLTFGNDPEENKNSTYLSID